MLESPLDRIVNRLVLPYGQADDAIAHFESAYASTNGNYFPGHVPSEYQRVSQKGEDQASYLLQDPVNRIDRYAGGANHDLTLARRGDWRWADFRRRALGGQP
ncbi:hypothetical protein GCM10007862_10430 [Dyella lipolytica]|nr:hypothetical protein GCM10007862_10430 [Dyella lipolytica]